MSDTREPYTPPAEPTEVSTVKHAANFPGDGADGDGRSSVEPM